MASPVTIQPSTADTYLQQSAPNSTAGGTSTFLYINSGAIQGNNIILSFNFASSVPAGAKINLATLSLYANEVTSGRTIVCDRLRRTTWSEAATTWNQYQSGGYNWGAGGALDSATDHDTANRASSASLGVAAAWQSWSVTEQIQYARDNVSGVAHFLLRDPAGDAGGFQGYYSNNHANTALRPKLYIEYSTFPNIKTNIGGVAKTCTAGWVNIGGVAKPITDMWINIGGTLKKL